MPHTWVRRSAIVLLATLALPHCTAAQTPRQASGAADVQFANSGAPDAQHDFLAGLVALHNFEYEVAATLFRRAQQSDTGFAMAFWGEALTYTRPIWMEQDLEAGRQVLQRLGATPVDRQARAPTAREKAYLNAVETLYGSGSKTARDNEYASAMAALARAYPDDVDATALAALALLGTAPQGRDVSIAMRAAAMIEPLLAASPRHPGLAHYLIHAYDDPAHAPLGLRAARAYSAMAPGAAHAQHMASHIFMALGMWHEMVTANETAIRLTTGTAANRPPTSCGPYPAWLMYGYLQQGRHQDARRLVLECYRAAGENGGQAWAAFAQMRSRYLIDTEEWTSEISALTVPEGNAAATFTFEYGNAFVALRLGNLPAGRAGLARMETARRAFLDSRPPLAVRTRGALPPPIDRESERLQIMRDEIGIMLGSAEGAAYDAIDRLIRLAATEDALPYVAGPPAIDKPTWELLGEMYLDIVDLQNARAAFERALARAPGRTRSLVGLMQAAALSGDNRRKAEIQAQLDDTRRRADAKPGGQR